MGYKVKLMPAELVKAFNIRLLTHEAVSFEVQADRSVGRQHNRRALEVSYKIVVVQLHGPAGVDAVLCHQHIGDGGTHAGEVVVIVAQTVLELGDRVVYMPGSVEYQRSMVDAPKRTSAPLMGWRQTFAARACRVSCNSPLPGGDASNGPMTEKHRRAHRLR